MKDRTLKEFIAHNSTKENLCFYYESYSADVKKMLDNIFRMCWRIGLYTKQTLMMLDESLKPFKNKKFDAFKTEISEAREMFDL